MAEVGRPLNLWKTALFVVLTLVVMIYIFQKAPIAQNPAYHQFADQRSFLGIHNALDVLTNVAFLWVGMAGVFLLSRRKPADFTITFIDPVERWSFLTFFVAIVLVGFGSAYYHWAPENARLTLDRLPMALAFMALFSAMISERITPMAGFLSLIPLQVLGAISVLYWHVTEQSGLGDLRLYYFVQGYTLLAIPILLLLFPARYSRGKDLIVAVFFYALAKVVEKQDGNILVFTGCFSGHSLKHVLAALAIYWILRMLRTRSSLA